MPTALALWLFTTGRWGSYVSNSELGLFITEIGLGLAGLWFLVLAARGKVDFSLLRRPTLPVILAGALLVLAIGRLIGSEELSRTALRDFAPYGYAAVAILTLLSPLARWERSSWLIFGLLAAHAAWVAVGDNLPELLEGLPVLGRAPMFAVRPDFDATVCGLGVAVCLYWGLRRGRDWFARVSVALLALAQIALVVTLPSRAGLLAALVSVIFVWLGARRPRRTGWRWVAVRVALVLLAIPIAALALAQTAPGKRAIDAYEGRGNASGSTNARQLVYETTWDYIVGDPARAVYGVGFGPDFMHETGADDYYEGELYTGVRSPHQYFLGTSARLGLTGGILTLLLSAAAAYAAWRVLRTRDDLRALDVLAAGAVVGIPIAAALGVVLESPFGAVPYFWAIGHLARIRFAGEPRESRVAETERVLEDPESSPEPGAQRSTRTSRPESSSSSAWTSASTISSASSRQRTLGVQPS